MTPNLAIILIASVLATLACVGVIAFVALVLSVARAQAKIDDQMQVIESYRSKEDETVTQMRGGKWI